MKKKHVSTEKHLTREEASEKIKSIAEAIKKGSVTIESQDGKVELKPSETVEFELEVEEEKDGEMSLEVEIEWNKNENKDQDIDIK